MYRYVMPDGRIVVTDAPLPEHAAYGYDVIDPDTDTVIRHVDPQRPMNEYEAEQARRRAYEACQNELRSLKYRYETVADIEVSRDGTLGAIDHRASVIRSELIRAELDLESNKDRAAENERAGEPVSEQVSANIDSLEQTIASLKAEQAQKVVDRQRAQARYAREIERFTDGTCDHLGESP